MRGKTIMRTISVLLIVLLIVGYNGGVGKVFADDSTVLDIEVKLGEDLESIELTPGETIHVSIPVITKNTYMSSPNVTVSAVDADQTAVSGLKIKNINLVNKDGNKTTTITFIEESYVEFDVTVKDTEEIGNYYFLLTFKSLTGDYTTNDLMAPCSVTKELKKAELTLNKFSYKESAAVIGSSLTLSATVKNEGELKALSGYLSVDYAETGIAADYSTKSIKLGDLAAGASKEVSIPIKILTTATEGTKELTFSFTYKDSDGTSYTDTAQVYVEALKNEDAPKLKYTVAKVATTEELNQGDEFVINATLFNSGSSSAYNTKVTLSGIGADTIIPNFTTEYIDVGTIDSEDKIKVKIPLIVSKTATNGNKEITITTSYEDADGVEYTTTTTVYPEVVVPDEDDTEPKPSLLVTEVTQSPVSPQAGDEVTLSFKVENKGDVAAKKIKLETSNLSADTFSPVSSEPYVYIEKLKAGASKSVTLSFTISDEIATEYGEIDLAYSYIYGTGTADSGTAKLNVLNIINDDNSASVPKVIVSNFSTDPEEIRASKEFTFNFDLLNTHASVAAKNIKVTLSQADNIFSVTSGSNSFYIDKIAPGETNSNSIQLKVKADAATKAYPLVIKIEYEYDGAEASPVTGEVGETVEETINLTAIENSRPNLDNVYLDTWTTPIVGQSATLAFQFYNMGKSQLSNVRAQVSGDFEKADGTEYFIGNVEAGGSEYVEMDVTPLVAGDANGVVTIIYEDSNGDELTMTKDFTATIMTEEEAMGDLGTSDDMAGMEEELQTKKQILPTWAFILLQIGILVIVTPVTRSILIKRYKRKLEKQEENLL